MKLYRIQRKKDKLFFQSFKHAWTHSKTGVHTPSKAIFCSTGVMYRKLDTLERQLQWLCTDEKWEDRKSKSRYVSQSRRSIEYNKYRPKFDPKRLKLYDIIIADVTVNGSTKISAHKLFGSDA